LRRRELTVPNLAFDVNYNLQSVVLEVLAADVPGDYNNDGTVDAADYVDWHRLLLEDGSNSLHIIPLQLAHFANRYDAGCGGIGDSCGVKLSWHFCARLDSTDVNECQISENFFALELYAIRQR
jgi:hypothetical protein